jgi:hypothetical protein
MRGLDPRIHDFGCRTGHQYGTKTSATFRICPNGKA